jgi:hypothetical protein
MIYINKRARMGSDQLDEFWQIEHTCVPGVRLKKRNSTGPAVAACALLQLWLCKGGLVLPAFILYKMLKSLRSYTIHLFCVYFFCLTLFVRFSNIVV